VRNALVLLSGGMDSTTLLAHTMMERDHVEALFVDYGQRHIKEQDAARSIAANLGIDLHQLDLHGFGVEIPSALTGTAAVPHGHYTAATMRITVVPNRNATLISVAAALAEVRGLQEVRVAVHAGDYAVYPDCRPEFIEAMDVATRLGCGVAVQAPFVRYTKQQIATWAARLHAPIHLSWSCYEGGAVHCGRCGTCVERAEAFHNAGIADPTVYADTQYWRDAVKEARV